MKRVYACGLVAAALLCSGVRQVEAAMTFDTTPSWNGSSSIGSFGSPDTATYGQTFIAPADNVLDDYSFHISGDPGVSLSIKAQVYQWSGSLLGAGGGQATGPALYSSPPFPPYIGTGAFQTLNINTGGVTLTPGTSYVALLTISDASDYAASSGTTFWGDNPSHVANSGGGGFVFYNNTNDISLLNTSVWDNFADYGDLAWTAHFSSPSGSPVPEPSTLVAIGLSAIGMMMVDRRRHKRRKESRIND